MILKYKTFKIQLKAKKRVGDYPDILSIQNKVQDLLKMYPADRDFEISFLKNKKEVAESFFDIYRVEKNYIAFYSPGMNTIYLSVRNLNPRVLAHEICHVILTKNFKIRMPGHIQEVICQWIETKF